jgi:hypothetical protein
MVIEIGVLYKVFSLDMKEVLGGFFVTIHSLEGKFKIVFAIS